MSVPAHWEDLGSAPGVALAAVEPDHGGAFRANIVVTVDALAPEMTIRDWQLGTEEILAKTLKGYQLLDLRPVQVSGGPGVFRLVEHLIEGATPVTLCQWACVSGGRGYTLSATASTLAYDELADLFASLAAGLRAPGVDTRTAGDPS